jgi:hypothetical protein
MTARQRYTLKQAQADQERYAVPWAQDHADGPDSPIEFMPPDPNKPWQAADVFVSDARPLPKLPEWIIKLGLLHKLAQPMGDSILRPGKLVYDLRTTPALPDQPNGPSVAEQIVLEVAAGRNVIVPCAHDFLEDPAVAAGAITAATGRLDYISDNNFIIVSPTMKYEGIDGVDLIHKIDPAGRPVWMVPPTPGAAERKIPRQYRAWYSSGVNKILGPILKDDGHGTITYLALAGSRMVPVLDPETGRVTAREFPPVYRLAAMALKETDTALPLAMYRDPSTKKVSWEVGNFIRREDIAGASDTEINERYMDVIMLSLRERMQRLAKVPVKYSCLLDADPGKSGSEPVS